MPATSVVMTLSSIHRCITRSWLWQTDSLKRAHIDVFHKAAFHPGACPGLLQEQLNFTPLQHAVLPVLISHPTDNRKLHTIFHSTTERTRNSDICAFFKKIIPSLNQTLCQQPRLWNSLPVDVQSASSLTTFRQKLITHLFRQSYPTLFYNCVAIVVFEVTFT